MSVTTQTTTERATIWGRLAVVAATIGAIVGATLTPMAAYAADIGSISGHVQNLSWSADIPGATVTLHDGAHNLLDSTVTNSTGDYTFSALATGDYTVKFAKPGYVSQWWQNASQFSSTSVYIDESNVSGIDATLQEAVTFSGTVTSNGNPVQGADVYAVSYSACGTNVSYDPEVGFYCAKTTTDALGNYSFETWPGQYNLLFHADGYVDVYNGGFSRQQDSPTIDLYSGTSTGNNAALIEGATISGTITELGSGDPIDNAAISAFTVSGDFIGATYSDSSGNYEMDGLLAGTYKLRFEKNGYLSSFWQGKTRLGAATPTVLTTGQDLTNVSTALDPGASVSGRITDGGVGVEGANVAIYDSRSYYISYTLTDADGYYTASGLSGGSYTVGASKWAADPCVLGSYLGGARTPELGTKFTLAEHGSTSGKDIALVRCSSIEGNIKGAATPNVNLSNVYVTAYDASGTYMGSAGTDPDGNYRIGDLPAGTYYIQVAGSGAWAGRWHGGNVLQSSATGITVATGATATVNTVLPIGGTISGDTTLELVGPVEDLFVTAYSQTNDMLYTDMTDADGEYTIQGLPADTYKVEFSRGYADYDIAVEWWNNALTESAGTAVVVAAGATVTAKDATLSTGATVTGHVTGAGGTPLEYVTVSVLNSSNQELRWEQTDADGNYSIAGIPAGSVTLKFSFFGETASEWWDNKLSFATANFFTVANGTVYPSKDAVLSSSGTISGRVTDTSGVDIDGVWVGVFQGASTEPVDYTITDGSGNYSVPGLAAGSYVVGFTDYGTGGGFSPTEGIQFRTEFFNNQPTRAAANAVVVPVGGVVSGTNAQLDAVGVLGSPTPTISGTAVVGQVLTAVPGTWTPAPVVLTYQWRRDGVDLVGKTTAAYTVMADDAGHTLTVAVTGTKSGYPSATVVSAQTALVTGALTAPVPTITGNGDVGQTLTAVPGTWAPAPVDLTYQWNRNGAPIAAATSSTYLLVGADAGTNVTVTVTGTKTDFATQSKTSTAKAIGSTLTAPTPTIAGSLVSGQTLTAVAGAWAPAPVTLTYQWKRDGVAVAGRTLSTYLLADADIGHTISVSVTGAKALYTTTAQTSAETATITGLLVAPVPTITGTGAIGQTLTAVPGAWGPAPVALSYQWNRNGVPIAGATASTYVIDAADAGLNITVTVTGTKTDYATQSKTSAAKFVGSVLIAPTPTITGVPTVGQSLTAVAGTWEPAPVSLSYQWKRNGTPIVGALSSVYAATALDSGTAITVTVTGTKAGFTSVSQTSSAVTVGNAFTIASVPTIVGSPTAGTELSPILGTWSPAPAFSYQWLRNGVPIPGGTAITYMPTTADAGSSITLAVTATKAGYTSVTKTSAPKVIGLPLSDVGIPTISGGNTVGQLLTADAGTWGPAPVGFSYQWNRGTIPIAGATASTYLPVLADGGKQLTVTVTGSKANYFSVASTSAPLLVGLAITAPTPTISGVPTVGKLVTAVAGAWAPAPVTLTYQWYRDGAPIIGSTASTYLLTPADAGTELTVEVLGTKLGYTSVTRQSAGLLIGLALDTPPVPTIDGIPTVGETLSVNPGAWGPDPVDLTVQWKRAGVAIAGATDTVYTLVSGDLAKAITVTVTGHKDGYTSASATSAAKAVGSALASPVPTVTGTPAVGSTLTAVPGVWGPAVVTLSYKWLRNGVAIPLATLSTYKLVAADAGQAITVAVTGVKLGYTTVVQTSDPIAVESLLNGAVPTIVGLTTVSETLSVDPGAWGPDPVDLTVQWKLAGIPIAGATNTEYTPVAGDAGKVITVTVTGSKPDYTSASVTSLGKTIGKKLTATPVPTLTGTPAVGSTLTAVAGVWAPAPVTLSYKWLRNGVAIPLATLSTYKLVTADAGQAITVAVTGAQLAFTSVASTSDPIVIESLLTAPVPTIAGVATVEETLSVDPGAWGPDPVDLTVQWKLAGVAIPGATSTEYTLVTGDIGKAITVTVTGAKDGYTTASATSAAKTVNNKLATTPTPTVTGTAAVGSTLTATAGVWGLAPVTLSYKWLRNGVAIAAATLPTYKLVTADAGQLVTVAVTGSKLGFASVTQASDPIAVESLLTAPVPTITGVTTKGQTLSVVAGAWGPDPVDLTVQWKRAGIAIPGAVGEDYQLQLADVGKVITVTVTGSKADYTTASATSLGKTIGDELTSTPVPTLSGTPAVGSTLMAAPGVWGPAAVTLSYKWLRNGVAIPLATLSTYKLVTADAGQAITVAVTGAKLGFSTVVQTSDPIVVESLLTAPVPTIAGAPTVNETLSVVAGAWGPDPVDLTFQWKRAGVAISGATNSDYVLEVADIAKVITVTVTGSKDGYTTTSTTSLGKTINNALTVTPVPAVTGTPAVGSTLTAAPGVWGPAPVTLSYKWLRNGVAIPLATLSTYKLVTADADQAITVAVSGTKLGYTTEVQTSVDLQIQSLLTAPVPTISGAAVVGEVLSVIPGAWAPDPVDLSYQWKRAGVAIAGATDSDYTLVALDAAKAITVTVTGSKDGYTSASATSAAKTVGAALTASPTPAVTGTPAVGSTLSAVAGVWSPAPVVLTYTWLRNGVAIAGATLSTYKLVAADAGQDITVTVTGTKLGYGTVTRTSDPTIIEAVLTAAVPTIEGVAVVNETLSVVPGAWGPDPVDLAVQWKRSGVVIPGATDVDYTLVAADAGVPITVAVTGSKAGFTSATRLSAAITPYASAPLPLIAGQQTVGTVHSVIAGTWTTPTVTLKYQWNRDGVAIAGATALTYTAVAADAGTQLTVTVTGSKLGYPSVARTSAGVEILFSMIATPRPSIDGDPTEGSLLTANHGEWGPSPVTLEFQWYADNVPIDGATESTYLVAVPSGTIVWVRVTGWKTNFRSVALVSPDVLIQPAP